MRTEEKIWYSFQGKPFHGKDPAWFNAQDYAWSILLEKNASAIRNELLQYLEKENTHLEDYFNKDLVKGKHKWKSDTFLFWGENKTDTLKKLPVLNSVLKQIDGLTTTGISVLEPHTSIQPHIGDTNAVIRAHLAIQVPAELPVCGIKVNGESRSWHEGKMLLFCDAYMHEAWNLSDEKRVVLIFDVLQEKFLSRKKEINKNVKSLLRLQSLELKRPFVKKMPGIIKALIRRYYYFRS